MTKEEEIKKKHDKIFVKTFGSPTNAKAFLKMALPEMFLEVLDLSKLRIDKTRYVDDRFKDSFTDMVFKTKMKRRSAPASGKAKEIAADIYILFEHKSYRDEAILIQLLCYMYLMWQKDFDAKRPLRVIVPVVFYHGKAKWNIPRNFNEQFDVSDEMREFLLNYRYILFDTADWDFRDERNAELRDNVFLLTSMALMKSAFNKDMGSIREIFKFWQEKGFTGNKEKVLFFLAYISETKDVSQGKLEKLLEESKIDGGNIMPTLADRLREEGRREGEIRGEKRGEKRGKLETARKLIARGVDINVIAEATGFPRKEIEKLATPGH